MQNEVKPGMKQTAKVVGEVLFWVALIAMWAFVAGCDGITIARQSAPAASERSVVDSGPIDDLPPEPENTVCPWPSGPPMDLPKSLRQANYAGGSCMHASLISVLRWQGRFELADWWRRSEYGAAGVYDLARVCRRLDLRFAWTTNGNAAFLDWCSSTRRGAAIHYFSQHAVTFCGYEDGNAVLLDNNRPGTYIRVPKQQFLSRWRGYGGLALTVVYAPPPPRPWR